MNGQQRVVIENVKPQINGGKFPAKRVVKDNFIVTADIYCDSHDIISAELIYKHKNDKEWQSVEMLYVINDQWKASFDLLFPGSYLYTIRAWVDHFKSWHRDTLKKLKPE